jgi:hypothetical protein
MGGRRRRRWIEKGRAIRQMERAAELADLVVTFTSWTGRLPTAPAV